MATLVQNLFRHLIQMLVNQTKNWTRLDGLLATRWPALDVTRAHLVVGAMSVVSLVLLLLLRFTTWRTSSVMDPSTYFGFAFSLSVCASIGWLVYRGSQYRMLPVQRRLARAHWIWFDLISLIAINAPAFGGVILIESRLRSLASRQTIERDLHVLAPGVKADSTLASVAEAKFNELWVSHSTNTLDSAKPQPRGSLRLTSDEPLKILRAYVDEGMLEGQEPGQISEFGIREAFENIGILLRSHVAPFLQRFDEAGPSLFFLGALVGLVLWVAALPGLRGTGLLGSVVVLVGLTIVLAIASSSDEELPLGLTGGFSFALILGVIVFGLLQKRRTFLTRSAMGAFLMVVPMAAFLMWNLVSTVTIYVKQDESVLRPAWAVIGLVALTSPCVQYLLNLLHSTPE